MNQEQYVCSNPLKQNAAVSAHMCVYKYIFVFLP